MIRTIHAALAAVILAAAPAPLRAAEGSTQSTAITRVDPTGIVNAYRASRIIGAEVVDDAGTTVGSVDDILFQIKGKSRVALAVLSVGDYVGTGPRLLVIPFESLDPMPGGRMRLPGAEPDVLKLLPAFDYPP